MVQQLRLCTPNVGARVQSLVRELGAHMLHSEENKTKQKVSVLGPLLAHGGTA